MSSEFQKRRREKGGIPDHGMGEGTRGWKKETPLSPRGQVQKGGVRSVRQRSGRPAEGLKEAGRGSEVKDVRSGRRGEKRFEKKRNIALFRM